MKVDLSADITAVIRKLKTALRNRFDYEVQTDIVSLFTKLEGSEVSWAAIRLVKYRSLSGSLKLLLRRFDANVTTVPIKETTELRVTKQGTWVSAGSVDEAVQMLLNHLEDLRQRVETAKKYGITVFDNRSRRRK